MPSIANDALMLNEAVVEQLRAVTAGCSRRVHLNNAGAALPTERTVATMVDHLRLEAEIGGYEAAEARRHHIEAAYVALAELVGGTREGIALFDNSTRAWNAAFYSVPLRRGDRLLTSRAEYTSNIAALWHRAHDIGCEVVVVPDDESGQVDLEALRSLMDDRVALIALTWIPTGSGTVSPVAEVGAIVRDSRALFLLDATQAVGQLDIEVGDIGCDLLTGTGRKFLRGPRGTGFSWTGPRALEELVPHVADTASTRWDGGRGFTWAEGARRFETWEMNYAAVLGLGSAAQQALDIGMPGIEERSGFLGDRLRSMVADIPKVSVHDRGARLGAIVTITIDGLPAHEVARALADQHVNVSTTSPEQNQLDMLAGHQHPTVRLSPHYYNTESEVERAAELIADLAS